MVRRFVGTRQLGWACAWLLGCSAISPLDDVKHSELNGAMVADETTDDGAVTETTAGRGAKAGSAGHAGAGRGGAGRGAQPPVAQAGRGGTTTGHAGSGGAGRASVTPPVSQAGRGSTDGDQAGDGATRQPAPGTCDLVDPQRPREPLQACDEGETCWADEASGNGVSAPTACIPAGAAQAGEACTGDGAGDDNCASGMFCDSELKVCVRFCAPVGSACDGGMCLAIPRLSAIAGTTLAVGLCFNISLML